MLNDNNNPMQHQEEQVSGSDGVPKFGRLLIVLAIVVAILIALTFGSLAYYET